MSIGPMSNNPLPTRGLIPSAQTAPTTVNPVTNPAAAGPSGPQSPAGAVQGPQGFDLGTTFTQPQWDRLRSEVHNSDATASEKLQIYGVMDKIQAMSIPPDGSMSEAQQNEIRNFVAQGSDRVKAWAENISSLQGRNEPAGPQVRTANYTPEKSRNFFQRILDAIMSIFGKKKDSNEAVFRPTSHFPPNQTSFGDPGALGPGNQSVMPQGQPQVGAADASAGMPSAMQASAVLPEGPALPQSELESKLYNAVKAYPNNKASDAEARQIAATLVEAGRAMNMSDRNIEKMLSVFAHESGGFDSDARSHTGAGGLGQLTRPAIEEIDNLSKPGGKFAQFRNNFVSPGGDRDNLQKNIWTSVAYMSHLMDTLGTQDISEAFTAYNVGPTGYRELSRLSTDAQRLDWIRQNMPNVSPEGKLREFKTYAGLVDNAYASLFSGTDPSTMMA